jgi:hypothetical protein
MNNQNTPRLLYRSSKALANFLESHSYVNNEKFSKKSAASKFVPLTQPIGSGGLCSCSFRTQSLSLFMLLGTRHGLDVFGVR